MLSVCRFSSASTDRCDTTSSASADRSTASRVSFRLARLGARQREQPVDERGQTIDLLEHAADDAAIRRFVAMAAQPDLAHAANRRQRRPQLVRDIGREPPHLIERRFETTQRFVEHRRQTAHLVLWIGHRQPVGQARRGDRLRAQGHLLDGRERAAGQHVAAQSGDTDGQRQSEHENQQQIADLLAHRFLRSCDLHDHAPVADQRAVLRVLDARAHIAAAAHHPHRRAGGRKRDDGLLAAGDEALCVGQRPAHGFAVPQQQFAAVITPDLDPGRFLFEQQIDLRSRHHESARAFVHGRRRPVEVGAQPVVERLRRAAADEHVDRHGVDGEDGHHDGDVPHREPHAHGVRSPPPAHGSPSRNMNPTPRTV